MARQRELAHYPREAVTSHYTIVLAAVAAARIALLKMHREGLVHDELLHALERDLDFQEVSAQHAMA